MRGHFALYAGGDHLSSGSCGGIEREEEKGNPGGLLPWKECSLIFEKTSTRTRCAFEVAAHDMGMGTTYLDPSGSQIGKKESIEDTARVWENV